MASSLLKPNERRCGKATLAGSSDRRLVAAPDQDCSRIIWSYSLRLLDGQCRALNKAGRYCTGIACSIVALPSAGRRYQRVEGEAVPQLRRHELSGKRLHDHHAAVQGRV
jgi:hypothetical protein